jgi:ABC-type oligopeptide transport system ATPase subunit
MELLEVVGLSKEHMRRYPTCFQGASGSASAWPGPWP